MPGPLNPQNGPNPDPANAGNSLAGIIWDDYGQPAKDFLFGTDDQWQYAQDQAKKGNYKPLVDLSATGGGGAASGVPTAAPRLGTPEAQAYSKNQLLNTALQLGTMGNILGGEGGAEALGAGHPIPQSLIKAKTLEKLNNDPTDIWQKSGWERGADGNWRFEIPDRDAEYDIHTAYMGDLAKRLGKTQELPKWSGGDGKATYTVNGAQQLLEHGTVLKVGDVLDHPDLYKAYPGLKTMNLQILPDHAMNGYNAVYSPAQNNISMANHVAFGPSGKSTLLHELQHAVQNKEGFAPGGNPDGTLGDLYTRALQRHTDLQIRRFDDGDLSVTDEMIEQARKDRENIANAWGDPDKSYQIYKRLAGETEARNVQERMQFGRNALSLSPPSATAEFPPEGQVVLPPYAKTTPVDHDPFAGGLTPVDSNGAAMTRGFHGTPHDFEAFSNHAMGTGEGAQAFGWGHYFAGNPKVAQDYQSKLAGKELVPYKNGSPMAGIDALEAYFQPGKIVPSYGGLDKVISFDRGKGQWGGDWSVKVQHVDKDGNPLPGIEGRPRTHGTYPQPNQFAAAAADRGYEMGKPGQLLEVAMKPDEHELLDYDKKLSEQTPEIQAKLKTLGIGEPKNLEYVPELSPPGWRNFRAKNPYHEHGPSIFFSEDLKTGETSVTGHRRTGESQTFPSAVEAMTAAEKGLGGDMTGEEAYRKLAVSDNPKDTSMRLHAAGIPGLKFLDQGSRQLNPIHSGVKFNGINMTGHEDLPKFRFGNAEKAGLDINNDAAHEALSLVHKYGNVDATLAALDESYAPNKEPPPGNPNLYKRLAVENREAATWLQNNRDKISFDPPKKPTHNYVIFDPSNIKITAKNGQRLFPVDHDPFKGE